jgi:hypothetical protein
VVSNSGGKEKEGGLVEMQLYLQRHANIKCESESVSHNSRPSPVPQLPLLNACEYHSPNQTRTGGRGHEIKEIHRASTRKRDKRMMDPENATLCTITAEHRPPLYQRTGQYAPTGQVTKAGILAFIDFATGLTLSLPGNQRFNP